MAYYSANKPNRTVTLHKPDCRRLPEAVTRGCGCASTDNNGNQQWFCEAHVSLNKINKHMNNRQWAFLPCHDCFANDHA